MKLVLERIQNLEQTRRLHAVDKAVCILSCCCNPVSSVSTTQVNLCRTPSVAIVWRRVLSVAACPAPGMSLHFSDWYQTATVRKHHMWDCFPASFMPAWAVSTAHIQFGQKGSNSVACLLGILESVSLRLQSCYAYPLDGGTRKRLYHHIVLTAVSIK